jgi:hypothetical protein
MSTSAAGIIDRATLRPVRVWTLPRDGLVPSESRSRTVRKVPPVAAKLSTPKAKHPLDSTARSLESAARLAVIPWSLPSEC